MGTLVDRDAAERACAAAARFLVSLYPAPETRAVAKRAGVLYVGGGYTPGEIAEASRHGICKLFPAHLGALTRLSALRDVLPEARIIPTGGIRLTEVSTLRRAGAVAVGVGSDLHATVDLDEAVAKLASQVAESCARDPVRRHHARLAVLDPPTWHVRSRTKRQLACRVVPAC